MNAVEEISDLRAMLTATKSTAAEASRELQQLEVEHTTLQGEHAKLQQRAAQTMLGNKQLKGACARLDDLVTYLVACVASLPAEPQQQHAALNVLAMSLHKSQDDLAKAHNIIAAMRNKLIKSVKPDGATVIDSATEVDKPS